MYYLEIQALFKDIIQAFFKASSQIQGLFNTVQTLSLNDFALSKATYCGSPPCGVEEPETT